MKDIAADDLGTPSVARTFVLKPDYLAMKFRDSQEIDARERGRWCVDSRRTRLICPSPDKRAHIPIILANVGRRAAVDYFASITFYSRGGLVDIVDVVTDTLDFTVYVDDPAKLSWRIAPKMAQPEIKRVYDDYMDADSVTHWGDTIYLRGTLEAGEQDVVFTTVEVADNADAEFFVVFSIDCADGWIRVQQYIQPCVIDGARKLRAQQRPAAL